MDVEPADDEPGVLIVSQPVTVTEIALFTQTVIEPPLPPAIVETLEPPTTVAGLTVKPALAGIGLTVTTNVRTGLGQAPIVEIHVTE